MVKRKEMKREIKFRAWHNGKMIYHHPLMSVHAFHITPDGKVFYNDEPGYVNGKNRDSIVMQYTGFKNKNGKDIYEGDLFRIEENDEENTVILVVVVWVQEWAMLTTLRVEDEYQAYLTEGVDALDETLFWTYTLEDIGSPKHYPCGNIYENPELIDFNITE